MKTKRGLISQLKRESGKPPKARLRDFSYMLAMTGRAITYRKEKNLTMQEVAKLANIDEEKYIQFEGFKQSLQPEELRRIFFMYVPGGVDAVEKELFGKTVLELTYFEPDIKTTSGGVYRIDLAALRCKNEFAVLPEKVIQGLTHCNTPLYKNYRDKFILVTYAPETMPLFRELIVQDNYEFYCSHYGIGKLQYFFNQKIYPAFYTSKKILSGKRVVLDKHIIDWNLKQGKILEEGDHPHIVNLSDYQKIYYMYKNMRGLPLNEKAFQLLETLEKQIAVIIRDIKRDILLNQEKYSVL